MKTPYLQAVILLTVLTFAFPAYWRREVESAEKLAYLNQATGSSDTVASSSTSSFEARYNAIMDTDSSIERELVGSQDEYNRQQDALEAKIEEEAEFKRSQELNPERYDPQKNRVNFKYQEESATSPKLDGGEQAYQKERSEIQKEFDKKAQKQALPEAANSPSPSTLADPIGSALANNPFYKGGEFTEDQNKFEEQKAVIRARLMASGYPEDTVQRLVNSASNQEDVIRQLMKENDVTYGEASDMVS